MPKKFKVKDVSFNIDQIELIEKTLSKPPLKKLEKSDFEYQIGLEIKTLLADQRSVHKLTVRINSNDEKELLGSLTVSTTFTIYNIEDLLIPGKANKIVLMPDVVDLLNTIAIGVCRGVLFSEFRGTFLDKAILPILDIKKFEQPET